MCTLRKARNGISLSLIGCAASSRVYRIRMRGSFSAKIYSFEMTELPIRNTSFGIGSAVNALRYLCPRGATVFRYMQGTVLAGSNNFFEVECDDGITRSCSIKGKVLKSDT